MKFIPPPTDSLYKFLAIAGLTSMIGGIILFFTSMDKFDNLKGEYRDEKNVLNAEIQILVDELQFNEEFQFLRDSITADFEAFTINSDSIIKNIIYNLPDSLKTEVKILMMKKHKLVINENRADYQQTMAEGYDIPYLILFYGGEIVSLVSFFLWYEKIQKPNDQIEQNKLLVEKNKIIIDGIWQEQCQSCLKTIWLNDGRGLNSDGEFNQTYCISCYKNGIFTEPNLDLQEMKKRLQHELKHRNYRAFKRPSRQDGF